MKSPFWIVVLIFVLEVCIILILIPGDYTKQMIVDESALIQKNLGTESQRWIYKRANEYYQASILDSGFYEATHQLLIPTYEERMKSKGMETMGADWFIWVESRLDASMNVVYQFYSRVAILQLWAPYMLFLFIPAIWDGVMTWNIKRTNFQYASPFLHRYSMRSMWLVVIGTFIVFCSPFTMHPTFIPLMLMLLAVSVGVNISNMQKRF
ncbi:DUF4400 domain-containing protein [Photobacterium ganghwense]|uniref:DUF4400 domain-containing protein n=1 Tax=Photobacterium ganghwense TaxID=320778 RepID=UPI001A8FAB67|nr:DUF4400 domain-containing protein [Photobacterium ganghwense]QSV17591.1 DUF4400 domain-containing protein [Photobacterium ganghwense]